MATEQEQTTITDDNQRLLPLDDYGINVTERGVMFSADLPFERWLIFGRFLKHATESVYFWRADWLEHGRKTYGTERVSEAITNLELDLGELKQADALNRLTERSSLLKPEHHFILARSRLDDVAQRMWFELSEKEKLTPRELEESIRAGHVVKLYLDSYERKGGFASIEGLHSMWKILRRQIGDLWVEWNDKEIAAFLRYVEPIEAFARQLRDKINAR
jgi:hypothetical protein